MAFHRNSPFHQPPGYALGGLPNGEYHWIPHAGQMVPPEDPVLPGELVEPNDNPFSDAHAVNEEHTSSTNLLGQGYRPTSLPSYTPGTDLLASATNAPRHRQNRSISVTTPFSEATTPASEWPGAIAYDDQGDVDAASRLAELDNDRKERRKVLNRTYQRSFRQRRDNLLKAAQIQIHEQNDLITKLKQENDTLRRLVDFLSRGKSPHDRDATTSMSHPYYGLNDHDLTLVEGIGIGTVIGQPNEYDAVNEPWWGLSQPGLGNRLV